ncbi:MAG: DUF4279 domain-containing protein [Limisphaerales bacterium]
MSKKSAGAALRVFTDQTDLNFISHCFGINATQQHRKGDSISKKNSQAGIFKESLWLYRSPLDGTKPLSEHIESILKLLEKSDANKSDANLKSLHDKGVSMDIFCVFSSESGQGSTEINALLLQRLAKQQISLIIDLYPPTESE